MPGGGRQPGAGRPFGSNGKAVVEREERAKRYSVKAKAAGIMPVEVMLETMRKAWKEGDVDLAVTAARDAAPFVHPRLASTQVESNNVHYVMADKPMSEAEWVAAYNIGIIGNDSAASATGSSDGAAAEDEAPGAP